MNLIWPIVSAVVAVAGALGIAYAVFKSATVSKTILLLESENTVLSNAVARQTADLAAMKQRMEELEAQNRALSNVVTGRTEIQQLTDHVTKEEAARRAEHKSMMDLLDEIKDLTQELWRGVSRIAGGKP